jgi:hypothetical protein
MGQRKQRKRPVWPMRGDGKTGERADGGGDEPVPLYCRGNAREVRRRMEGGGAEVGGLIGVNLVQFPGLRWHGEAWGGLHRIRPGVRGDGGNHR